MGQWRRANYFADDVRMVDGYSYRKPGSNVNQFMMVNIVAGNMIELPEDNTLSIPPVLPHNSAARVSRRYDTVTSIYSSG